MYDTQKRKQYLINKEFQFKFIIKVYVIVFTAIVAVGILLFYLNDKTLSYSAYQQVLSMKTARDLLLPTILSISAVTAFVALIIVIFRFVLESHRIAGPIYRFEKVFEAVESGDLTTTVKLREKDEMQDLSEKFNTMISSLRSPLVKSKEIVENLKKKIDEKSEKDDDIILLITTLEKELAKIKTAVKD